MQGVRRLSWAGSGWRLPTLGKGQSHRSRSPATASYSRMDRSSSPWSPTPEAAPRPLNAKAPQVQTSATTAVGPEAGQRRRAAFPPVKPNSQPVSFLISSSSSSRSNVEARDPITVPGAPPGAAVPEATVAGGRERGKKGLGVKKGKSSASLRTWEGTQGRCVREAAQRPANQERGCGLRQSRRLPAELQPLTQPAQRQPRLRNRG